MPIDKMGPKMNVKGRGQANGETVKSYSLPQECNIKPCGPYCSRHDFHMLIGEEK